MGANTNFGNVSNLLTEQFPMPIPTLSPKMSNPPQTMEQVLQMAMRHPEFPSIEDLARPHAGMAGNSARIVNTMGKLYAAAKIYNALDPSQFNATLRNLRAQVADIVEYTDHVKRGGSSTMHKAQHMGKAFAGLVESEAKSFIEKEGLGLAEAAALNIAGLAGGGIPNIALDGGFALEGVMKLVKGFTKHKKRRKKRTKINSNVALMACEMLGAIGASPEVHSPNFINMELVNNKKLVKQLLDYIIHDINDGRTYAGPVLNAANEVQFELNAEGAPVTNAMY